MSFYQQTFILFGVLLVSSFQFEGSEGVRVCGKRLADLLNFLCEKHGGFHAPKAKREVPSKSTSKRALVEIFRPLSRRTADSEVTPVLMHDSGMEFNYQSGIVNECCKKQCTVATMMSYCANAQQTNTFEQDNILSLKNNGFLEVSDQMIPEYQVQQASSVATPEPSVGAFIHPAPLPSYTAYSSRPSIGLSSRNRPVFIVSSQLQHDEDGALGEYRF